MAELLAIPAGLASNLSVLTEDEGKLATALALLGQSHLFEQWEPPGQNDDKKKSMLEKLHDMDSSVVGGISGYLERARSLLQQSNTNPFVGWRPEVPQGVHLEPFTPEYSRLEALGLSHIGSCGFVLVAGGLGERLGFHGIKVALPVETVTRTCYLELYIQQIQAIQARYGAVDKLIPLAIMVSDDTHEQTVDLLRRNHNFGLKPEQITLMKQGEVPALASNDARIASHGPYGVEAKPHGHGDVHSLLHSTGTAAAWSAQGVRYVVFFQDTNGLAFFTLPAMLGVSEELGLEVNSLAIPRVAKQAIGAIAKLVHDDGREMTINVEYNQLDPLLRSTVSPSGDTNDAAGRSPYPGNINQLVFRMEPYLAILSQTGGLMPEFVNPKYQDESRTVFKKPTRLECMMQDYPKLLPQGAKVGFTLAPEWICFSPCKNNSADAAIAAATGLPAASPFTAESDQYRVMTKLLMGCGVQVEEDDPITVEGVSAQAGPRIVLHPSCCLFPCEFAKKFPQPQNVVISSRSALVLVGDVTVERMELDGALQLCAAPGNHIVLRMNEGESLVNMGYRLQLLECEDLAHSEEVDRMRGYMLWPYAVKKMDFHASLVIDRL